MSDASKRVEAMQERLDEIQEEIDEARADAENVDPQRPKETFIASSNEPSEADDADASARSVPVQQRPPQS
jgi:hypothetical protein